MPAFFGVIIFLNDNLKVAVHALQGAIDVKKNDSLDVVIWQRSHADYGPLYIVSFRESERLRPDVIFPERNGDRRLIHI
jgi:hypothetical protein